MGHAARESHKIRSNRRSRSAAISKAILETHLGNSSREPDPESDPNCEDNGWGYCSEEQLEEILLRNLEVLYNEAVSKIVVLGYDEDVALRAVLKNGHCYGGMDVLTNILHNSLAYLSSNRGNANAISGNGTGNEEVEVEEESCENSPVFSDLRQIVEYSLACMVHLLRQFRPGLSKGDAMWCLLMSDLHVGHASSMEIPVVLGEDGCDGGGNVAVPGGSSGLESVSGSAMGVMAPMLCRFHSGWGFGASGDGEFPVNGFYSYGAEVNLPRDVECSRRFNISPSMRCLLKRNMAAFAAGYRASHRKMHSQLQHGESNSTIRIGQPSLSPEVSTVHHHEFQVLEKQGEVDSVLNKFCDLSLDEKMGLVTDEQKDGMIVTLLQQISELEEQVKERKEWAHQKAMQAARKLSNDLNELKYLRAEREDNQKLKNGKQMLEDNTLKRLSEMESALRKARGQVDRANAAVRRLENENAEVRAEMEASKLSASESARTRMEVAKREKKFLKRILAWEKQKAKLQEEIGGEKVKMLKLQQDLAQIKQSQKDIEVKCQHELKAKEIASAQVEEEQKLKEAAEANSKRRLESLQLKTEIDFQRHKDDLQRLERELSRLKASAQVTGPPSNAVVRGGLECPNSQNRALTRLINGLDKKVDSLDKQCDSDRECIICRKDEVSVVFLPCAHQVLCSKCNDSYGKKGKATCPSCRVPIKQRIRVFGANT